VVGWDESEISGEEEGAGGEEEERLTPHHRDRYGILLILRFPIEL